MILLCREFVGRLFAGKIKRRRAGAADGLWYYSATIIMLKGAFKAAFKQIATRLAAAETARLYSASA